MTRAQAWEKFQAAHQKEQEQLRQTFWDNLQLRLGELMQCIFTAFEEIGKQEKEQEKDNCMYFLYSLQRCDLLKGKAIVRLDVTGVEWYLDEEPLSTAFDLTFLFQEYFDWQEKLLLDMREYMGKVNKYDVSALVQDEIMVCNQLITHILRFAFRSLEQQEVFQNINKLPFWIIRWGEYKDNSEIVMQVKRDTRDQEVWEDRLKEYEENPGALITDYWYQENLTEGDCHEKNMYFIVFEECSLKGIDFSKADLTGARFIRCRIEDCNFGEAILHQADFESCSFAGNDFRDARLTQATFSAEGFLPELFDEKQLEDLLIVEDMAKTEEETQ